MPTSQKVEITLKVKWNISIKEKSSFSQLNDARIHPPQMENFIDEICYAASDPTDNNLTIDIL